MTPHLPGKCLRLLADILLPRVCVLCGQPQAPGRWHPTGPTTPCAPPPGLCACCLADLPGHTRRRCRVCALPLAGTPGHPSDDICAGCVFAPPSFDAAKVLADYAMPIDRLIHAAKYRQRLHLLRPVALALADHARVALPAWPDRIMAVPLANRRLRERGYNQALLIARTVARRWQCPLDTVTLYRVRTTDTQRDLSMADRHANMTDAFACRHRLDGARVVLVDDVMTTGLTLHWAARALRQAGAASVLCLAVARTAAPGKMPA